MEKQMSIKTTSFRISNAGRDRLQELVDKTNTSQAELLECFFALSNDEVLSIIDKTLPAIKAKRKAEKSEKMKASKAKRELMSDLASKLSVEDLKALLDKQK
jgi:predicted DNA-binding protein